MFHELSWMALVYCLGVYDVHELAFGQVADNLAKLESR